MEIDIITYTDAQYAALNDEQLQEVRQAQIKKNRLTAQLEKDIRDCKNGLIDKGIYLSDHRAQLIAELQATYNTEVALIRDALLFYLRFSSKAETEAEEKAPYVVDYSLSYEDRLSIVRNYYEATYTDGTQRFEAFTADTVAPQYLGELYAPLYDYYMESA